MKFYFAYKQRKQTCCWFLPNLYKTEFGFQIFFYKHLLSAQQEMHSFSYLYFYRKQSQSKVWVGVDLLEKFLHRWAWQTGTPKIICTRNEQELPFKNESKLPLIFEQRNIVSVKYVMCYSLRQIGSLYSWQGCRPCEYALVFLWFGWQLRDTLSSPLKQTITRAVLWSYMYLSKSFQGNITDDPMLLSDPSC